MNLFFDSVFNYVPKKVYNRVLIDLRRDDSRAQDIISGQEGCMHMTHGSSICHYCGGFVGHIGYETEILDFYKHTYSLILKYPDTEILTISERLIPNEYTLKILGNRVYLKRKRYLAYCKREELFVSAFFGNLVFNKAFLIVDSLINIKNWYLSPDMLWINPRKEDLGYDVDYVVCEENLKGMKSLLR